MLLPVLFKRITLPNDVSLGIACFLPAQVQNIIAIEIQKLHKLHYTNSFQVHLLVNE